MLQPKRMKHRKMMKRTHGGLGGVAMRGNTIASIEASSSGTTRGPGRGA
jgi:hypothetical protein